MADYARHASEGVEGQCSFLRERQDPLYVHPPSNARFSFPHLIFPPAVYEHLPSSIPGRPSPSPIDATEYELYGEESPETAEDVMRARGGVPRLVAFSDAVKIA